MRRKCTFVSIIIIILFSLFFFPTEAVAQTEAMSEVQTINMEDEKIQNLEQDSAESTEEKNDYFLPYPGILTDHPLYFLKRFRDQLMEILITDPLKKIEFQLLQSDKFIGMTMIYSDQNKWDRVIETSLLSFENKKKAFAGRNLLEDQKSQIPQGIRDKIYDSTFKHIDVLENIVKAVPEKDKEKLTKIIQDLNSLN